MIYLDNAATTPVRTEALQAAWPFLTNEFGNPSSTHELGGRASNALDGARERLAHWFGARGSEIIFTSGGTESDNLGIEYLRRAGYDPRAMGSVLLRDLGWDVVAVDSAAVEASDLLSAGIDVRALFAALLLDHYLL